MLHKEPERTTEASDVRWHFSSCVNVPAAQKVASERGYGPEFVRADTTDKKRRLGFYDAEAGIKTRPGVTHLLNCSKCIDLLSVCNLPFDTNAVLVILMGRTATY